MYRLSIIFSDIELGAGTATDDFVEDALLCSTIRKHFTTSKKYPADLVLNGDTFDFLKCPYHGGYPRHITAKISMEKLEGMHKAHPHVFAVWREWLKQSPTNRLVFVYGNHDFDLVFPQVRQKLLKILCGNDEQLYQRVIFPGFEWSEGLLLVEHGSQLDPFFRVDPSALVYYSPKHVVGEPFLLLPWGYNALYDHYIHIKEKYPLLERLVPRIRTLEALPLRLKKQIYFDSMVYMAKSFFYTQFVHWRDPMYRFGIEDFFKYVTSFVRREFDLGIVPGARRKIRLTSHQVLCVGHSHRNAFRKMRRKKIFVNTGNWRDEYRITHTGRIFYPKKKSYAYVLHSPWEVKDCRLIYVESKSKPIPMTTLKEILRKD